MNLTQTLSCPLAKTIAAFVGATGVTLASLARNFYGYIAICGLGAIRSCCYPAARDE